MKRIGFLYEQIVSVENCKLAIQNASKHKSKRELRKAMKGVMAFVNGLGLTIKHDYQLYRIQRNCKSRKHRKGRKIDFVGRCFGVGFTTIRKRRALALMRQSRFIQKLQRQNRPVSYHLASGFLSRCACFKHTNSEGMRKKYYDTVNIKKLKEVIRNESKRKCLSQLAHH